MATKFLDLDGLKYFKTKLESLFSGKFVPQGLTINGTALNTANITITDDTKLSKTDASTLYLTKADASTTYLGLGAKASTAGAADTAAKLATARTINGVSFDGSTNITIHATDSTARIAASLIGAANGVAPLGSDKKNSGAIHSWRHWRSARRLLQRWEILQRIHAYDGNHRLDQHNVCRYWQH